MMLPGPIATLVAKWQQGAATGRFPWAQVLLGWLVIATIFSIRTGTEMSVAPLIADTDDAMRLTVVHDLLNGQGWFDHVQHRLNAPYGAEIHWSRLIDLPIAGLLVVLRPLLGASADVTVAFLWPMILLFGLVALSAGIAYHLAGRAAVFPALVLPALSLALTAEFEPGRLDHHSVQILLALAMLLCALRTVDTPAYGVLAGALAATSLAIGTEGLPMVAAAVGGYGVLWVIRPERAQALALFGAGLLGAALVHLVLALPPVSYFTPACDAFSFVYVGASAAVAFAFLVLAALPLGAASAWARLVAGGALGGGVLVALAVLFPACLGGPYADVDPWLVRNWINYIAEAKPIWQSFTSLPAYVVSVVIPPVLALVVVAVRLLRHTGGRSEWAMYGLFLLIGTVVMVLQVRGARFTAALAVPAGAYLIVSARDVYLRSRKLYAMAGLLLGWVAFAGVVVGMAVNALVLAIPAGRDMVGGSAGGGPSKTPCLMPANFAELAKLPPMRMITPIDLGAHMLLYTPHAVVAAPYHRNEEGVRDTFDFFNQSLEVGRQILERRGIDTVVICPGMPEMRGFGDAAPDSFIRLWQRGALPNWLVDESIPDRPFDIYSVR